MFILLKNVIFYFEDARSRTSSKNGKYNI